MDRYKKYLGLILLCITIVGTIFISSLVLKRPYQNWQEQKLQVEKTTQTLEEKRNAKINVLKKLKKLKESVLSSQKKIYSPSEENTENDTLFFTLYSDVIDMVRANTIKIKSIDYQYNPKEDLFVAQGAAYFVCDVDMEIVSNYISLGRLIQDIYQYPYYIKINNIDITPYPKDKKILLSKISLRLYAHTMPETDIIEDIPEAESIEGAQTPLPQS